MIKNDSAWPAFELATFTSAAMYALHQGGLAGWLTCGAFTLLALLTLVVTH